MTGHSKDIEKFIKLSDIILDLNNEITERDIKIERMKKELQDMTAALKTLRKKMEDLT